MESVAAQVHKALDEQLGEGRWTGSDETLKLLGDSLTAADFLYQLEVELGVKLRHVVLEGTIEDLIAACESVVRGTGP